MRGPVTQQALGVRRLVDLHVPTNHGSEPNFSKVARHSRAVLESSGHPAPKTPTFSVFSAMHDTMLGEVNAMPLFCFADLRSPQLLSSFQSLQLDAQPAWHVGPLIEMLSKCFCKACTSEWACMQQGAANETSECCAGENQRRGVSLGGVRVHRHLSA